MPKEPAADRCVRRGARRPACRRRFLRAARRARAARPRRAPYGTRPAAPTSMWPVADRTETPGAFTLPPATPRPRKISAIPSSSRSYRSEAVEPADD
jgi:hypothetical protein